jgi:YVTN family beta-propeller protein
MTHGGALVQCKFLLHFTMKAQQSTLGVRMRGLRKTVFLTFTAFVLLAELGCGDQYRPVANPVVSPGGQPQTSHFAWVVNYNPNGDGSTTEIDVSGDTNLAVNTMGVGTSAEAFPTNSLSLYVANAGDDTVMQYLPTLAGSITTISLLPGSHPIALTSQTNTAMFVLNSGTNSACSQTGSLSTISSATLSVATTVCLGPDPIPSGQYPVGVNPTAFVQSPANGFIYVVNQGPSGQNQPSVSVMLTDGSALKASITPSVGLGLNPVAVAANNQGWIFIVTQGDQVNPGTLDLVYSGNGNIAATAPLGVLPTQAVFDPTRNRLYVTNSGDNSVSVFDVSAINPSSPSVPLLAKVTVGTTPIGVTALTDGSNFFVANAGDNTVTVVSQSSFSPLTTVPLPTGANPVYITSDPTAAKVYVADQGTGETTIIQTSNNTVTQSIPAPTQLSGCTSSCALQQPVMILTQ